MSGMDDEGFVVDETDPRNIRTREMLAAAGWVSSSRWLAGVDALTIQEGDRIHIHSRYAGDFGFDVVVGKVEPKADGSYTLQVTDPRMSQDDWLFYRVPPVVPDA